MQKISSTRKMANWYGILLQGGSVLLLTGPSGCGKSATLEILAKDLGIQVQEWINPVLMEFRKDHFQDALNNGNALVISQ